MAARARRNGVVVLVGFFLLACLPFDARADRYADTLNRWSIDLPSNWQPMGRDALQAIDEEVARRAPDRAFTYVAGFVPSPPQPSEYPYVLVQSTPMPLDGVPLNKIKQAFCGDDLNSYALQLQQDNSDVLTSAEATGTWFDDETRELHVRFTMEVVGIGRVRGVSRGFLGRDQVITVHYYDTAAAFTDMDSQLDSLVASFQFDSGSAYTSPTHATLSRVGQAFVIGAAKYLFIMLPLGLLIWAGIRVRYWITRSSPRHASQEERQVVKSVLDNLGVHDLVEADKFYGADQTSPTQEGGPPAPHRQPS